MYRFRMDNDWTPSNSDTNKTIDMKLTADMLTIVGFTAVQLGKEHMLELTQTNRSKQFYVGISGGGFRALSGHMGTFRTLSNTSLLSKVTMFSSVSGGSWFLSKLSFDKNFAEKVLGNDVLITEVVSEWFEKNYFPQMQRVDPPDSDGGGNVSERGRGDVYGWKVIVRLDLNRRFCLGANGCDYQMVEKVSMSLMYVFFSVRMCSYF